MDAQVLRRALHDFFRFNPKDFYVRASPTGFLVGLHPVTGIADTIQPFQLIDASNTEGTKVRVVESTLIGQAPDGFSPSDDPPYTLSVSNNDIVYAGVTLDVSGEFPGLVTDRFLDADAVVPPDDPIGGSFYLAIGQVTLTEDGKGTNPVNFRYGPIDGTFFRVWFALPKQFGIAWAMA